MTEGRPPRRRIEKHITVPDSLALACEQFNRGDYWDCHETLEEIWQEEQGDVRDLYKGLIQLAAAFVHVGRNNHAGADRLLRTGMAYLEPYRSGAMGFDVDGILRQAAKAHTAIVNTEPGALDLLPAGLAPTYGCDEAGLPAEARRWSAWGFDAGGRAMTMTIDLYE